MIELIASQHWDDYELLDSGNFEKLERFGRYVLARPEPQAVWDRRLAEAEWQKLADARYVRDSAKKNNRDTNVDGGGWFFKRALEPSWEVRYQYKQMSLAFKLQFTSFGHVGVFPEQADNWNFIYDHFQQVRVGGEAWRMLNLFAYTGGASLAARAAGATVFHVDAVKSVITWANDNTAASGLEGIRWVVEDALKFAQREVKRGAKYHGIVLDPPAYGRGPQGEKWVIEEQINELIGACSQLLMPQQAFLVLNLYSMGLSSLVANTLVKSHFANVHTHYGELYVPSTTGQQLPLGTFLRFTR